MQRQDPAAWKAWNLDGSPPLPDAVMAMVTPLDAWPDWWLLMTCRCQNPRIIAMNTLAKQRPGGLLANAVTRLVCHKCRTAPQSIDLSSTRGMTFEAEPVKIRLR